MVIFAYFGKTPESDGYIRLCKCAYDDLTKGDNRELFFERDLLMFISSVDGTPVYCEKTSEQVPICATNTVVRQGKPGFAECTGAHFNLSHTDGLSVCVFASAPVGADVEKVVPRNFGSFGFLGEFASSRDFYREWTKREAVLKLDGCGIEKIRSFKMPSDVHTKVIPVGAGYVLTVAERGES